MKKYLLLLVLSVLCCWTSNAAKDEDEIFIFYKKDGETRGARTPARIPFDTYVDDSGIYVRTVFEYSLGIVSVEIMNNASNTSDTYTIYAEDTVIIPLSLSSGSYTITFTLESGAEYYGEFEI